MHSLLIIVGILAALFIIWGVFCVVFYVGLYIVTLAMALLAAVVHMFTGEPK